MQKTSRAESQAKTREQLLVAAERLFLRDGYAITTLERVAAEAGFSKGAVYSNFAKKDELCLAVLDRIHARNGATLIGHVGTADSIDERLARLTAWAEGNIGETGWTVLEVEFATANRTNEDARRQLRSRRKFIVTVLAQLLQEQSDELGVALPVSATSAAEAVLALGTGLGVQRSVDPSVSIEPLIDLIRTFTQAKS